MANNTASQFSADIENYIQDETLPLARRQLVVYQFGDPLEQPEGRGTTYTATRYLRVPLPFAPLSEGVPPVGQQMSIQQVSAVALQWGDRINITDVAELTIKHPLFKKAIELCGLAIGETLERNTFNAITAFTQVNYVNTRGSRFALQTGDVMNLHEINRVVGALKTIGAPRFMGDEMTDTKVSIEGGQPNAAANPRSQPHYVAVTHPMVEQDLRENSTFVLASSYSDINKLYNSEIGELGGVRFVTSNLCPSWTGVATLSGTPGTAGNLATNNYFVLVTASDTTFQQETRIYQVSGSLAVTGATGSVAVTLPALPGFTFSAYIGLTSSPTNLALSTAGPTSGPLQGQATQMAPGQTVVLTAIGTAQTPPAPVATGLTVYPVFVFGRGAYGQVMLQNAKFSYLEGPDKSDPLNQIRIVGWKVFYGTIILNQQFAARIEGVSAFTPTFG